MTPAPTPHAADVASLATLTERAAETRIAMLIGTGGLAVFWAFLVASGRLAHLPIALGPTNLIFAGLIALDLAAATSARTWAEWRWTPYVVASLHAVVLTALLHYIGGLRMGIFFITYAFVMIHTQLLRADASVFVTANVCALCYAGLAWVERATARPGLGLPFESNQQVLALAVFGFVALNCFAVHANRYGYQLRHLAERLREMVAERTIELTAANRELAAKAQALEEKQEQLKDFVYIVTHDLKNPVSAILLTADLLLERGGGSLDDDGRQALERIVRLAGGTEDMIRDLLGLFKITSAPEAPRWVELDALVANALEHLGPQVRQKVVRVRVGPLPRVWGQSAKLGHVVTNLLSNAVKYVPRDVGEVDVRGGVENGHVVVSIADNGIGIPSNYHRGIFELFGRVPAAEQAVDGVTVAGTGVGLAIVKRIVEAHRGTVSVESEPGAGSRFTVCLPAGAGEG